MTKLLLASIAAGVGMFMWSAVAHMALPLGEAGVSGLPNEATLTSALHAGIGQNDGFYIFPDPGPGSNSEKMARYTQKIATSPQGLLIYHPPGTAGSTGRQMTTEFLTELVSSLLALSLLSISKVRGYWMRVSFVFAIGVIAAIGTNLSYWNWYGFPGIYTAAYIFTQIIGFLVAGMIGTAILKEKAASYSAAA